MMSDGIPYSKTYYRDEQHGIKLWAYYYPSGKNNDKHTVVLQFEDGKIHDHKFNLTSKTECLCDKCAWRRTDKKAEALLKAIGVKR